VSLGRILGLDLCQFVDTVCPITCLGKKTKGSESDVLGSLCLLGLSLQRVLGLCLLDLSLQRVLGLCRLGLSLRNLLGLCLLGLSLLRVLGLCLLDLSLQRALGLCRLGLSLRIYSVCVSTRFVPAT
jgi:hypothetical protein